MTATATTPTRPMTVATDPVAPSAVSVTTAMLSYSHIAPRATDEPGRAALESVHSVQP